MFHILCSEPFHSKNLSRVSRVHPCMQNISRIHPCILCMQNIISGFAPVAFLIRSFPNAVFPWKWRRTEAILLSLLHSGSYPQFSIESHSQVLSDSLIFGSKEKANLAYRSHWKSSKAFFIQRTAQPSWRFKMTQLPQALPCSAKPIPSTFLKTLHLNLSLFPLLQCCYELQCRVSAPYLPFLAPAVLTVNSMPLGPCPQLAFLTVNMHKFC